MAERGARGIAGRVAGAAFTVRGRITLAATAVVAFALVGAGFLLVSLQREALTDNVDATVTLRSEDVVALLSTGSLPEAVTVSDDEIALVQVLDADGEVVAASPNIRGAGRVSTREPALGETTIHDAGDLPLDDGPYRVLSRTIESPRGRYTVYVAGSLEDVDESIAELVKLLQAGIPVLVFLVGLGTWFLVGRALAPVEAIRREVAEITQEQLSRRVPERGRDDEIGRLARTMNAMLRRLQASSERQAQFVADASHELRSPLAAMRAEVEVDLANPESAGGAATLEGLHGDILRLQRLIDDLLVLAATDAGGTWRDTSALDFDDIVLAEVAAVTGMRGPIAVDTSAVSAGAVRGDAAQLRRVVRNLIENAVRHARSRVVIELREAEGRVTLAVTDDGPGVPADSRGVIFERFQRLDAGRGRGQGGAGLGLTIARAIVEGHGGSIAVEEGPGGGARFVVTMPALGLNTARP